MFGKLFESTFTGTLFGSGPTVFAVWAYVIANAEPPGVVELNPNLLACCIGTDTRSVQSAIDYLCGPDPQSRNPEQEGRRLIPSGSFQYQVVSFEKYRNMRDREDRLTYQREWDRKHRPSGHARQMNGQAQSDKVRQSPTGSDKVRSSPTKAEAEAEAEKKILSINGRDQFAEWFESFWNAYPRKTKKPAALKSFRAVKPSPEVLAKMLEAIEASKVSEQWQDAKYIPYPATWLNNRRWEDEELPLTSGHRNAVAGTRFVA